jgi:uncharacterized phage protein (TIGR01671 family)
MVTGVKGGKAMNERFLFRGKRIDTGEWVYGGYYGDEKRVWIMEVKPTEYGRSVIKWEVDPATIGQCTGLRDKAGKLIFEGDKVHVVAPDIDAVGVVTWVQDDASFCLDWGREVLDYAEHMMWLEECYEVIGSVHDNAEEG